MLNDDVNVHFIIITYTSFVLPASKPGGGVDLIDVTNYLQLIVKVYDTSKSLTHHPHTQRPFRSVGDFHILSPQIHKIP